LAEGEELWSNPLRAIFNDLQTTQIAVDVDWRILSLVPGVVTHRFKLNQIEEAYDLFGQQRDGVLKVAVTP
jgi:threonine dehydrogenase-like Zn-dependent dehydrogenase